MLRFQLYVKTNARIWDGPNACILYLCGHETETAPNGITAWAAPAGSLLTQFG